MTDQQTDDQLSTESVDEMLDKAWADARIVNGTILESSDDLDALTRQVRSGETWFAVRMDPAPGGDARGLLDKIGIVYLLSLDGDGDLSAVGGTGKGRDLCYFNRQLGDDLQKLYAGTVEVFETWADAEASAAQAKARQVEAEKDKLLDALTNYRYRYRRALALDNIDVNDVVRFREGYEPAPELKGVMGIVTEKLDGQVRGDEGSFLYGPRDYRLLMIID